MNIDEAIEFHTWIMKQCDRRIRGGQRVGYNKRKRAEAERLLQALRLVKLLPKLPKEAHYGLG